MQNICLSHRDNCRRRSEDQVVDSWIYVQRGRAPGKRFQTSKHPTIGASVRPKERKAQKRGENRCTSVCRSRRLKTEDCRLETEEQRPKTEDREADRDWDLGQGDKDCERGWGSDQSVPRWWVQVYWRGVCANSRSIDDRLLQKCGRVTLERLSPANLCLNAAKGKEKQIIDKQIGPGHCKKSRLVCR